MSTMAGGTGASTSTPEGGWVTAATMRLPGNARQVQATTGGRRPRWDWATRAQLTAKPPWRRRHVVGLIIACMDGRAGSTLERPHTAPSVEVVRVRGELVERI